MTPHDAHTPDDDAPRAPVQDGKNGAWATPRGRRQLFTVAAADFVVWAGGGAIFPYLPVFLQDEAGASLWWIGVIAAAYFVGVFTVSPFAGRLSDRVGRKPLLVGGTLMYGAATLLFITTTDPALFVLFRLLEGVSVALIVPAGQAFIAEITTDRNRSQAYGWWTSAQFGGLLIGPALAWPLYELGGGQGLWAFYSIFIFGSALSFVAAAGLAILIREPEHAARARRERVARPPVRSLLTRPVVAILIFVATAEFTMGAWEVIWSIWLDSHGKSFAFIGLTWIAFSAPMLLSFVGGRLADRHSRFAIMVGGFTVQALVWFVFSLTTLSWAYVAALVVGGLAFALAFPAKQALLVQVSPARWLGSVQGIEQTSMQGAAFVGTLVAPLVYGAIGGWIFAVCGAVALAGVAVATPILHGQWACIRAGSRSCAEHAASEADPSSRTPVPGETGAPADPVGLPDVAAEADVP